MTGQGQLGLGDLTGIIRLGKLLQFLEAKIRVLGEFARIGKVQAINTPTQGFKPFLSCIAVIGCCVTRGRTLQGRFRRFLSAVQPRVARCGRRPESGGQVLCLLLAEAIAANLLMLPTYPFPFRTCQACRLWLPETDVIRYIGLNAADHVKKIFRWLSQCLFAETRDIPAGDSRGASHWLYGLSPPTPASSHISMISR